MGTVHALPIRNSAFERYDNHRLYERCAVDQIAEMIAQHLYTRHYDDLPAMHRARVEGAALRAVRAPQTAWKVEAATRAQVALERAMAKEMGADFAQRSPAERSTLARIGVQVVISALLSAYELSDPFSGPGEALRVYEAAEAEAREVR